MKISEQKKKVIYAISFMVIIGIIIAILYPYSNNSIKDVRTHSYIYKYKLPNNLKVRDVSSLPEAKSVPMLMYHGVIVESQLGENIERKVFISQMEMLKREGYQTISLKEYDLWRNGKFTLPKKPIIITFDDGRKDSYYTTDDIFKKLGFKATIFVATIKPIQNDPFYITWKELLKMKSSLRWEIESHGRDSHTRIVIDKNGGLGTYLTSRIYSEAGLESIPLYEKRVEQDYINVKSDLLNNLGIKSDYYAIPFAEYGIGDPSNHPQAFDFNKKMSKKYFKYTFESYSSSRDVLESFYNYKDTNPYETKRLNVKNMNSEELLKALNLYSAKPKKLFFTNKTIDDNFVKENLRVLYGTVKSNAGITLISDPVQTSTRIILGDQGWTNYGIKTNITKEKGRSVSVLAYYTDEDNFIFLNWGDEKIELVERLKGVDYVLDSHYPLVTNKQTFDIILSVRNGLVSAKADDIILKSESTTKLKRGAVGFTVWDPNKAQSTINNLELIEPINY